MHFAVENLDRKVTKWEQNGQFKCTNSLHRG